MKSIDKSMSNSRLQRYLSPLFEREGLGVSLLFLLCLCLFCACSEDEDKSNGGNNGGNIHNTAYTVTSLSEPPVWQMDWSGDQQRPNWQEPNPSLYANWTLLNVQIEEELEDNVTKDDLMAIFINGELRGCARPDIIMGTDMVSPTFQIKAYGNETGSEPINVSLQYYCHKLKQLFTQSATINDWDESLGYDDDFIPAFTSGSAKYPVVTTVNVDAFLEKADIIPIGGNIIGAFVGDECRGTATISATGSTSLLIRCRTQGELITLKYYDNTEKKLYTIRDIANL